MTLMKDAMLVTLAPLELAMRLDTIAGQLTGLTNMQEVKEIRDKSEAIRVYLRQQKGCQEAQNAAAILSLRAQRRLGQLNEVQEKADGGDAARTRFHDGSELKTPPTYADLGIAMTTAHRWRTIASIPEAAFEARIAEAKETAEEITTANMITFARGIEKREEHATKIAQPLPIGTYRCIVIDPPWPMERIEREVRPNQPDVLDYPTMSLDEIGTLPIGRMAAEDGAHIYLWTTQKFLPAAFGLFEKWGVRYECLLTWLKPGGMTPYSWQYNTEHCLFGHIGKSPLERMGLKIGFDAPRTGHSIKPDRFYEMVREASPEPRLEMFARASRKGFDAWGNEGINDV